MMVMVMWERRVEFYGCVKRCFRGLETWGNDTAVEARVRNFVRTLYNTKGIYISPRAYIRGPWLLFMCTVSEGIYVLIYIYVYSYVYTSAHGYDSPSHHPPHLLATSHFSVRLSPHDVSGVLPISPHTDLLGGLHIPLLLQLVHLLNR